MSNKPNQRTRDAQRLAGDEIYSTGNPELDLVLGGGLPGGALSIITGPPGAGKTVLAIQMAFAAARASKRVVYLTNVSQSHARLIKHTRSMTFYDETLITKALTLVSINTNIQSQGIEATINFILEVARDAQAELLIIDSYLGIKQLFASDSARSRETLFNLMSRLSLLAVTTLLVGEYTPDAVRTDAEFAVADAIIELSYERAGMQRQRTISVLKLRGKAFLEGLHACVITQNGLRVFPRQEVLTSEPGPAPTSQRQSTGIDELDTMLGGGLLSGSTTLISGAMGTGKSLLGLSFVAKSQIDQMGLHISFQATPAQTVQRAAQVSLTLNTAGEQAPLKLVYVPAAELILDAVGLQIRQMIATYPIKRLVIDSIDQLEYTSYDPQRVSSFMNSLLSLLQQQQITTLLIRESPQLVDVHQPQARAQPRYLVDTIILLQYIALEGRLEHGLAVIKARATDHDRSLRQLKITASGLSIGQRFASLPPGMPALTLEPQGEE